MARRDEDGDRRCRGSSRHVQPLPRRDVAAGLGAYELGGGFAVAGSYAEGIAQPTFFDLYGFFPGSFVGNPSLKPESSRGFEASLRFRRGPFEASLTGYRQRLHDEIVDVSDPATFLSSTVNQIRAASHRSGIEAEFGWQARRQAPPQRQLRLSPCDRAGPDSGAAGARSPAARSIAARSRWTGGRAASTYGASLAYVGRAARHDSISSRPSGSGCSAYWLAGARLAYAVRPTWSCSRGRRTCSTAISGRLRIPDRRPGGWYRRRIRLADRRSSP